MTQDPQAFDEDEDLSEDQASSSSPTQPSTVSGSVSLWQDHHRKEGTAATASIQAALVALQAGHLSLNQVIKHIIAYSCYLNYQFLKVKTCKTLFKALYAVVISELRIS